jgi:hypothetical protein
MRIGGKGRIRVNRDQALLLSAELSDIRHRLVIRRADARDKGEDLASYQFNIKTIGEIQEEVGRTIEEMGWTSE